MDRQWRATGLAHRPYREVGDHLPPGDEPEQLAHPTTVLGTGPIAGFELVMSRIWD